MKMAVLPNLVLYAVCTFRKLCISQFTNFLQPTFAKSTCSHFHITGTQNTHAHHSRTLHFLIFYDFLVNINNVIEKVRVGGSQTYRSVGWIISNKQLWFYWLNHIAGAMSP